MASGALALLLVQTAAPPVRLTAQAAEAGPAATGPLSLADAIRIGRERGVAAQLARLQARAAETRIGQRQADLLPFVAGGGSIVRQTLNLDEFGIPVARGATPAFSVWRWNVRAQQALVDPAAFARVRAAREQATAAGLDAEAAGELAGALAGGAWLRAISADETVRARAADSAVAAALLGQARELVRAGVSPAIDATRSEVAFQAVRTQLALARNQRDRARLDLLRALDEPPGATLTLADTALGEVGALLPSSVDEAVAAALASRGDVRAEGARADAARRQLGAIRREFLPSVVGAGQLNESGRSLDSLRFTWSAQLAVTVPLLDGFRRQRRVAEQQALLEAQAVRERDVRRQAETDARQAWLDLASADEQVAIAGERVRLAEQELAQAQERFTAGIAGSVETTQAQASVIAARDALIQSRVARGSARVALLRAVGRIEAVR
ncbi:MAG: TolC family protein [Gemmatimonadales bacterium]|nr:TolC family protein [Gemmatimonadales bacterium]